MRLVTEVFVQVQCEANRQWSLWWMQIRQNETDVWEYRLFVSIWTACEAASREQTRSSQQIHRLTQIYAARNRIMFAGEKLTGWHDNNYFYDSECCWKGFRFYAHCEMGIYCKLQLFSNKNITWGNAYRLSFGLSSSCVKKGQHYCNKNFTRQIWKCKFNNTRVQINTHAGFIWEPPLQS